MGDTFEDVCSNIRACIVPSQSQQLSLKELNREYKGLLGEYIPYKKFQYEDVEDFLRAVPDLMLSRVGSELYIRVRANEKIAHIDRLVKEQKNTKKKKNTSKRNFGFGRASLPSYPPRKKWHSPPLGNRVNDLRNNGNSSSAPDQFSGPERLIRPSFASSNNIGRNSQSSRTSNLLRPSSAIPGDCTKRVFHDYLHDRGPNVGRNSESSRTLHRPPSSAVPGENEQRVVRDHLNDSRPSSTRADDSVRDRDMNVSSRPSSARADDSARDRDVKVSRPFSDRADDSMRGHLNGSRPLPERADHSVRDRDMNGSRPFLARVDDSSRGPASDYRPFPERADHSVRDHDVYGSRPFSDRPDDSVRDHVNGSQQCFRRADDGSVRGQPQHESQITKVVGAEERNEMPVLNRTLPYASPREPAKMASRNEDHLDSPQPSKQLYSNYHNVTSANGVSTSREDALLNSMDDSRLQIGQILRSMKNIAITIKMGSSLRSVTTDMPARKEIHDTSPVRRPYSIKTMLEGRIPSATVETPSTTTPRKNDLYLRPDMMIPSAPGTVLQEGNPIVDLTGEGSPIIWPEKNYLSRRLATLSPCPARLVLEREMSNVTRGDASGDLLAENDLRHRINMLKQKKVPTVTVENSPGNWPERSDLYCGRPYSPRTAPEGMRKGYSGICLRTAEIRLAKLTAELAEKVRLQEEKAVSGEDSSGILLEKNNLCHRLNLLRQKKTPTGIITGILSSGTGPGKLDHHHGLDTSKPENKSAVDGQNSSGTLSTAAAPQESTSSIAAKEEVIELEYSLTRSKSLPSIQLQVKQLLRVRFMEITHPTNFMMQPLIFIKELENLSASMKLIYDAQKPPVSVGTITKGNLFAVRNEEFKVWSRGEVIEVVPDLDQVSFLCIDYGNIISVNYRDVYQLMQCFYELPALAIKAALSCAVPTAGKWTTSDRARFRTLLTGLGDTQGVVVDVRGDTLEVLLYLFANKAWRDVGVILHAEERAVVQYAP